MDTHTSAHGLRMHRLFIAVPLFLIAVLVSVWAAMPPLQEEGAFPAAGVRTLEGGGMVLDASGAVLVRGSGGTVVRDGTVTVIARGIVRISACGRTFAAWAGGMRIGAAEGECVIAALTTPVLIEEEGVPVFVVLPSMQVTLHPGGARAATGALARLRALPMLPLPQHYLRTHLPAVREAAASTDTLADGSEPRVLSQRVADLAPLRRAPLLLPAALEERDAWFLASFHPLLKQYAWVLPIPSGVSAEDEVLRLLLLPESDRQQEGVQDAVIRRWGGEWERVVTQAQDPVQLLSEVLPTVRASLESLRHDRYPARAKRYAAAFLDVVRPWERVLPESAHAESDALSLLFQSAPPVHPLAAPAAASPSSAPADAAPVTPFDAEALQSEAKAVLTQAGIMFTRETSLSPLDALRVAVRGAVIGGRGGDRLVDFTLLLPELLVERVVQDGKTLPHSLPLAEFVEWGRGA